MTRNLTTWGALALLALLSILAACTGTTESPTSPLGVVASGVGAQSHAGPARSPSGAGCANLIAQLTRSVLAALEAEETVEISQSDVQDFCTGEVTSRTIRRLVDAHGSYLHIAYATGAVILAHSTSVTPEAIQHYADAEGSVVVAAGHSSTAFICADGSASYNRSLGSDAATDIGAAKDSNHHPLIEVIGGDSFMAVEQIDCEVP